MKQRFFMYVLIGDGCWEWTGTKSADRYGRVKVRRHGAGPKTYNAHRLAWQMANGDIPDGLVVCHRCDNPACVRVAHLFLGTNLDNIADRHAKGRDSDRRGEKHHLAKLNNEKVLAIRRRAAAGESIHAIAKDMGVTWGAVKMVVTGQRWAHVRATVPDVDFAAE